MLLSFAIPEMLPMICAGIAQARGEAVTGRVKRQTIRRRGPRAERLLKLARAKDWACPYDLHLWWKSRTKEGERLGVVRDAHIYPITIMHTLATRRSGPTFPMLILQFPSGRRFGANEIYWSGSAPFDRRASFDAEARADGFDSVEAFRDFFVPNLGDRFEGILFKW